MLEKIRRTIRGFKDKESGVGILTLELRDTKTGQLLRTDTFKNLITNAGLAGRASRITGSGAEAAFTYIALGTGTTPAANTDTALETEIATGGGARKAGSLSRVTTSVANDTAQLVAQFDFTASFAVTEAGILNASSGGTLYSHRIFSAYNVSNGTSLTITWKLQQTRA